MSGGQFSGGHQITRSDHIVKAKVRLKLKMAGLNLSHQGLDQVLGAQNVSSAADRQELAKLVSKVADSDLGSWSKATGLEVNW